VIDLSNIKAPGWQRVVAELAAPAPDDRAFLARMVAALGQVSAARQAVLHLIPRAPDDAAAPTVEAKPVMIWPAGGSTPGGVIDALVSPGTPIENEAEVKAAARAAHRSRQVSVFGLDKDDQLYDAGQSRGYLLAVPVPDGLPSESPGLEPRGVITLVLDPRSRQAVQATLAMVEILAGYVFNHAAMQTLGRTKQASAALDLATRLIAALNTSTTFKGAKLQFVNDICRQLGVDRVSMGWIEGGKSQRGAIAARVIAMSDTENVDRRMDMVQKVEAAMDECLDQEQPVLYPPPAARGDGSDYLLSQAIVHSHRELASRDANMKLASIPMRVEGRVVGVLTIESTGAGQIDLNTIELLQATLDLVSPVLEIRRSDDRTIAERSYDWGLKTAAWAVGPRHVLWKAVGILVFAVLMLAIFVKVPYRVGAPMTLEPRDPRTIAMPFDGVVASLGPGIELGTRVKEGDLILQLDTVDLRLKVLDAQNEVLQYQKQADEARKKRDGQSEAQQYEARAAQASAKLELFKLRIDQAAIKAPIGGTIIAGDLKDRVRSSVQMGQALVRIADVSDMLVIAKVDDRDIRFMKPGMTGQMTLKSEPSITYDFTAETVVPLSEAKDGKNAFEVRCRVHSPPAYLRPGMEGRAKFNVDKRSVLSIASRRIVDTAKLWLWW
jgi:multidrug efflux pump subunit AcrA (membrane-fusion protein)